MEWVFYNFEDGYDMTNSIIPLEKFFKYYIFRTSVVN